jgi:hypothetical protein
MEITQTECHSDKVKTDAVLRGVKFIDYNKLILEAQYDLEQMRAMHKKHNIKDVKSIGEMTTRLETMELLVREWVTQAGYANQHRVYAITILVEEIKT